MFTQPNQWTFVGSSCLLDYGLKSINVFFMSIGYTFGNKLVPTCLHHTLNKNGHHPKCLLLK
ncbi:hypothetical protein BLOT_015655 [Blomia tropicalis]|nr:hypothetical protein BLOT_015655 [Blomia tropicalis]